MGEDSWSMRMLDSAFGDFNEHTVEFFSFCFKGDLGADDARRFRSAANGEPHTADSLSGIWLKLPVVGASARLVAMAGDPSVVLGEF
jgi:hypothetical protein